MKNLKMQMHSTQNNQALLMSLDTKAAEAKGDFVAAAELQKVEVISKRI